MDGIKYRSADEMKDSGIQWLGRLVPLDWKVYRAKYIWKKENRPVQPDDMVVTAFRDGQVTLRENRRTEGFTFAIKEIGYQRVLKGDLVISAMDAFAGAMGISESTGKCSPVYSVCSPFKPVEQAYYGYLLKDMAQKNYILSLAKGIRERSTDFRYAEFGDTILTYPTILEQRKIANFLNIKCAQFDSIIAKKEQLIAKLEEAKKSLISEVVTGKVKIVDGQLVPRQPEEMKNSGVEWLGMIPKEWNAKKIKYIKSSKRNSFVDGPFGSNLKSEHYVDDGDVYIVESGFISTGEFLNKDFKTITNSHFNTIKRSSCTEGDIVIAKIGANFGMSGILPKLDKPSVVSGNSLKLSVAEQYSNKYIQYSLLALRFQGAIHFIVNGSAQPALTLGSLNELKMCAPPIIEQFEIVEISDRKLGIINNQINRNLYQISLLKSAKQSLITEAVTGKIDLRDWEIIEQGGAS